MNRRNFLSKIGKICAAIPFVGSLSIAGASGSSEGKRMPTKKEFQDALTEVVKDKLEKRSGTESNARCNCPEQQIVKIDGRIVICCPRHAPYWQDFDGSQEVISFNSRTSYYTYWDWANENGEPI